MIEDVHLLVVTEKSEKKMALVTHLQEKIPFLTCVDTSIAGLSALKHHQYHVAILSLDNDDFYSQKMMIQILREVESLSLIIIITESENKEIQDPFFNTTHSEYIEDPYVNAIHILRKIGIVSAQIAKEREWDNQVLLQSEATQHNSLFDSVPTGLYRINTEGDFLEVNKTLVHLLRAPRAEALLADNFFSLFYDTDDRHTWKESMKGESHIRGLVYEIERYDGQPIWVRDTARAVHTEQGEIIHYDGSIEDITYEKKLEDRLSFLSTQDILTGLPNRNFFQDQARLTISQARYNEDMVAFLIVDLDFFTDITSHDDPAIGDRLLQMVATKIKSQLRKSDLVSRLGGDIFAILLAPLSGKEEAISVAKKVNVAFSEDFSIGEKRFRISASTGISLFPDQGDDVNNLLSLAEIAVKAVKERQRGGFMVYSPMLGPKKREKN